jgi:hypothetical protein
VQESVVKQNEKLDDLDYHAESAIDAGMSEDAGGSHIAYFLIWSHERGYLANDVIPGERDVTSKLQNQDMEAFARLLDWVDGAITTDMLTSEGRSFARSCYDRYLNRYPGWLEVSDEEPYAEPTWERYERVKPMLDQLMEQWREEGCA